MCNKRPSVKIMRQYCLECQGGSKKTVKECSTSDCLIHPLRFGKNPALARKGKSPDEMVQIRALKWSSAKGILFKVERSANST
jgi:hypothetical protein